MMPMQVVPTAADTSQFSPFELFAITAAAAAVGLLMWLGGDLSDRWRHAARAVYTNDVFPIWFRGVVGVQPIISAGGLLLGTAVLLPRPTGPWLGLLALDLIFLGLALTYRRPVLPPRWLRDEIERGLIPVARPDRLDWVLFWLVLPVVIVANVGMPLVVAGLS